MLTGENLGDKTLQMVYYSGRKYERYKHRNARVPVSNLCVTGYLMILIQEKLVLLRAKAMRIRKPRSYYNPRPPRSGNMEIPNARNEKSNQGIIELNLISILLGLARDAISSGCIKRQYHIFRRIRLGSYTSRHRTSHPLLG